MELPALPDPLDRDLVKSAYGKRAKNEALSRQESAALRRFESARENADRLRYYASISKKHWSQFSGRKQQVLNEQAARWGIPIGEATIDLAAVVRWLHDFLAKNARKLAAPDSPDPLTGGDNSPAKEQYIREKTLLARLDRREREGTLVDREKSHQCWSRVAGILQQCGDALQREHGPAALRLLNQALADAQREVDQVFDAPRKTDLRDDSQRAPLDADPRADP
jgi:hypothetical protein